MKDPSALIEPLRHIHSEIRRRVLETTAQRHAEDLAQVDREDMGDTIYAIDAVSEAVLFPLFEELSRNHSFVLIAEGMRDGRRVYPADVAEDRAAWRIIVDPIDGTRGLMYQKRSAWILTGVAPNQGDETVLQDIVLAIQTEIPLVKQFLADQVWALKGQGATAERWNRLTAECTALQLRPSTAESAAHGFATVSRFFPGALGELAALEDEIVTSALGPVQSGKAHCFEDQYISSGGQLYELMAGHDRFVADLRPLLRAASSERERPLGLCCHPYDVCTALIAQELGVIVTGASGEPLNAPLNLSADVAWVGYANEKIRRQIEPCLQRGLRSRGWIGGA